MEASNNQKYILATVQFQLCERGSTSGSTTGAPPRSSLVYHEEDLKASGSMAGGEGRPSYPIRNLRNLPVWV